MAIVWNEKTFRRVGRNVKIRFDVEINGYQFSGVRTYVVPDTITTQGEAVDYLKSKLKAELRARYKEAVAADEDAQSLHDEQAALEAETPSDILISSEDEDFITNP